MFDPKEYERCIMLCRYTLDLHTMIQEQAKLASNDRTRKALESAADALDNWMHDELTNGVLHTIESMEEDEAAPEYLRELRQQAPGRQT